LPVDKTPEIEHLIIPEKFDITRVRRASASAAAW